MLGRGTFSLVLEGLGLFFEPSDRAFASSPRQYLTCSYQIKALRSLAGLLAEALGGALVTLIEIDLT